MTIQLNGKDCTLQDIEDRLKQSYNAENDLFEINDDIEVSKEEINGFYYPRLHYLNVITTLIRQGKTNEEITIIKPSLKELIADSIENVKEGVNCVVFDKFQRYDLQKTPKTFINKN